MPPLAAVTEIRRVCSTKPLSGREFRADGASAGEEGSLMTSSGLMPPSPEGGERLLCWTIRDGVSVV